LFHDQKSNFINSKLAALEVPRFFINPNLIMACHITGVYDVNRNTTLEDNNYELVRYWAESIAANNLHGIIFHNNYSEVTCRNYENENISFIRIKYNTQFNPNVYRYFVYKDFLQKHIPLIKSAFITDVSDVVLIKNPFIDSYFTKNPTAIFCGDEPEILDNKWMRAHGAHLRNKISDYSEYENQFATETLLNCGIIGARAYLLLDFIRKLCELHEQANSDNQSQFTGDMGVFNYLARTQFNRQLKYGAPVNTIFKLYQNERKDCWFRHK
jgi:hypothetical protein